MGPAWRWAYREDVSRPSRPAEAARTRPEASALRRNPGFAWARPAAHSLVYERYPRFEASGRQAPSARRKWSDRGNLMHPKVQITSASAGGRGVYRGSQDERHAPCSPSSRRPLPAHALMPSPPMPSHPKPLMFALAPLASRRTLLGCNIKRRALDRPSRTAASRHPERRDRHVALAAFPATLLAPAPLSRIGARTPAGCLSPCRS